MVRQGTGQRNRLHFGCGTCYLYHEELGDRDEADFLPAVLNIHVHIISSNRQADELADEGLESRLSGDIDRNRLDRGAVAFCIFMRGELAHRNWIATAEAARACLTWLPCRVDFSNGEAYVGPVFTHPEYRGLRLWTYTYFRIRQYLKARGIASVRYWVAADNTEHRERLFTKFGIKPYARAVFLRIFHWTFVRELSRK